MGPEPVRIRHAIYPAQPTAARSGTAGLQVTTFAGPSLVVEIYGEIDIFSAPGLRDELLRVIRRYGPQLALDLAGVTFIDCAGVNVLLATGAGPGWKTEWAFGLR